MRAEDPEQGRVAGRSAPNTLAHAAAVAALVERGGEVRVFADADNCVRPRAAGEAVADGGDAAAVPFVIEVEGTPNLFHELAHVVLLGRLAKDHATDYAKIPIDLASDDGRRLLFEELACCIASCAWHPGTRAEVDGWLDEQVDIQPCFFRRDGDLRQFLHDADAAIRQHPAQLVAICDRVLESLRIALLAGTVSPCTAAPHANLPPLTEWARLLDRHVTRSGTSAAGS